MLGFSPISVLALSTLISVSVVTPVVTPVSPLEDGGGYDSSKYKNINQQLRNKAYKESLENYNNDVMLISQMFIKYFI
jgi:hypothetical protein